jgi:hypothetical protein
MPSDYSAIMGTRLKTKGDTHMSSVELGPTIAPHLEAEAARRHITVAALVNQWLEEQLWLEKHKKIQEEMKRYVAQYQQLRTEYPDKVIAMREGQVIEVGDEVGEIYRRVRERFGDEAILITRVGKEPVETYTIRSPRLVEPLP